MLYNAAHINKSRTVGEEHGISIRFLREIYCKYISIVLIYKHGNIRKYMRQINTVPGISLLTMSSNWNRRYIFNEHMAEFTQKLKSLTSLGFGFCSKGVSTHCS